MPDSRIRKSWLPCSSVLIAALVGSCGWSSAPETELEAYCSMAALLSNPDRYDGKIIQTEGVLRIVFEGDSIWLSREHLDAGIVANSIGIVPPYENKQLIAAMRSLSGEYVLLKGTFHKGNPREVGTPRGAINEISFVTPLGRDKREFLELHLQAIDAVVESQIDQILALLTEDEIEERRASHYERRRNRDINCAERAKAESDALAELECRLDLAEQYYQELEAQIEGLEEDVRRKKVTPHNQRMQTDEPRTSPSRTSPP